MNNELRPSEEFATAVVQGAAARNSVGVRQREESRWASVSRPDGSAVPPLDNVFFILHDAILYYFKIQLSAVIRYTIVCLECVFLFGRNTHKGQSMIKVLRNMNICESWLFSTVESLHCRLK